MNQISGGQEPTSRTSGAGGGNSNVPPVGEKAFSSLHEGIDFIDTGNIVTQQFLSFAQSGLRDPYEASLHLPILMMPDVESSAAPRPFESDYQRAINKFFRDKIQEIILKKIKDPERTQEAHVNLLIEAALSGEMGKLSETDRHVIEKAREKTQKAWNLPPNWKINSQVAEDWTPTTIHVIPPIDLNPIRTQMMLENLEEFFEVLEKVAIKTTIQLPLNDPNQIEGRDLIDVLTRAINELKKTLMDMQVSDIRHSIKTSELKAETIELRKAVFKQRGEEWDKSMANRAKQAKQAKQQKLLGPLLATVALLVIIKTMGTASLVVGVVMLAFSIVDSQAGLTSQLFQKLNEHLEATYPGKAGEGSRWGAKIGILIGLIIAFTVAVWLAPGVAANLPAAIAQQTVVQVAALLIASSNIVPEMFGRLAVACGGDKTAQEIMKALGLLLMMVGLLFGTVKSMKAIDNLKIVDKLGTMTDTLQSLNLLLKSSSHLIDFYAGISNMLMGMELARILIRQGSHEKLLEIIEALMKMLDQMLASVQKGTKDTGQFLVSLDQALASLYSYTSQGYKGSSRA